MRGRIGRQREAPGRRRDAPGCQTSPVCRGEGDGAGDAGDAGAAVVDFVMVSVLLLLLLFAVLQIAVYFYARNVVASSAADAARFAAAEGVDPREGAGRAEELIGKGLDDADARSIRCVSGAGVDAASQLPVSTVRCTGRLRLLFSPLGLPLTIDVRSSVLRERQP